MNYDILTYCRANVRSAAPILALLRCGSASTFVLCAILLVLGMLFHAPFVQADVPFAHNRETQQITAEEEKIQAAFIWQFLQFIEFPVSVSPQEPFVIGIVGATRVEIFLSDIVKQKQLGDERIFEVRKITNIDDVVRCNVVFIAPTESVRLQQILSKTRGKPILTIGRDDALLEKGGLVNFYVESAKVRFEYNADEIPTSKLRFSSKLLRLGRQFTKK